MRTPSPTSRRWLVSLLALLALCVANPVTARDRQIEVRGLLVKDELTANKIERRVLKSGIKSANRYRILSGLYVVRAPSLEFWEDQIGPALEDAMESDRPVESLRGTLLNLEEYLIAGPDDPAVRIVWETPGDRGQGFINFAAPVLIGPDPGLVSHTEANKFRVVTGWFVDEADDDPEIESVGLKSRPDNWTGGDVRLPRLSSLPDRGEGAWVKYKGRSVDDEGDEMEKNIRSVEKLVDRDYIAADRALPWPQESGEYVKDVLTSARYRTRAAEIERGEALKELRGEYVEDWEWETKKIKHPTRYGVSTITVNAETERGDEVAEVFGFVYFYTPLMVDFDAAHLYVGTSPEFFATAVQKGEVPFFDREGDIKFYLGHLDRWVSGEALENGERAISRRIIEKTAGRWVRELNGNDARAVEGLAKNPNHWPLRAVENEDDDSDRPFKVMAYKDDLVSWWRRFERSLRPDDMDWFDPVYTLSYSGEATSVEVGELFGGETRALEMGDAVAEAEAEKADKLAERENAGLSEKERQRVEEERRKEEAAKSEADRARAEEKRQAEAARKREEARKAEDERKREEARIAQANAPIDVRLMDVAVGARTEGKPYLATRAGKSVQVKVKYDVEGKAEGHKIQVVAQAYDRSGNPIKDFAVKSTSKTPAVGENETTTWLKVPSSYTSAAQLGSYRVLTSLELDGVPLRGEREEFVHLGSALDLKRIELDPSVVLPGEEAVLLMDMAVGGWSVEDDVALTVDVKYSVDGTEKVDQFNMTRNIGFHELEVDLDVPEDLPAGDGTYSVQISHPSGVKSSQKGTLRVFAKEIVDNEPEGGGRRGRRQRVAVDEDDEVAALAAKNEDDDDDRDVVRRADRYEDEDEFDFDAIDEEAEVEEEERQRDEEAKRRKEEQKRERAEAEKRREDEEREQAEEERRRRDDDKRKADKKRKADDDRRAEEDKQRKADEDKKRKAEADEREADDEDLELDDEDLDLDDEDIAADEEDEPPPKKKKKPEPESVAEFDWDNLPETVFFEDEEEEVMMWAEADGVGVVRIYGEPALDKMGNFYGQFEQAYAKGAPEWLWVCYEGDHKPHLKFFRYSGKEDAWLLVHTSPIKFPSRDEKKAGMDLMKAVFEGFVPERKKKIPFGKL
ncbi:MAG: hypothetical protein KDA24_05890 [Deltaproteobacteria bacterium]|nr:hypothetical protein [Deltaproteobacteria bacterium]